MRLPEIAQPPGHGADEAQERQALRQAEEARLARRDRLDRSARRAAGAEHHDQRHQHQRDDHDAALDEIGQADGQKPAYHRIGEHHESGDPDAHHVIAHSANRQNVGKGGLEQLAAADEARRSVDREEDDDHEAGHDAQRLRLVGKAIGKKFGNGQRIAHLLGLLAQARGDDDPVRHRAHKQPDPDPRFDKACRIKRTGQAQQQPSAHVGGPRAERRDRRVKIAPGQHVPFAGIGRSLPGEQADPDHQEEIEGERYEGSRLHGVARNK